MFSQDKKFLIRFCGWFAFFNTLLLSIGCYRYFSAMPWIHTAYLSSYGQKLTTVIAYTSYFAQLALISGVLGIVIMIFAIIFSARYFFGVAIIIFSLLMTLMVADSFVYSLYHYHLSTPIFEMILQAFTAHVFDLSWQESMGVGVIIFSIFLIETIGAYYLWQKLILKRKLIGAGKWLIILFGMIIYLSYAVIFYTANSWVNRILVDVDRVLPFFSNVVSLALPSHVLERSSERYLIQPDQAHALLHYPNQPLIFSHHKNKLNVVIIAIDTWRFDMLNAQVMPSLAAFSKRSWYFSNHMSGGDSTGPGIFSLFYGLPSTYWTSMESAKQGPVLIKEFLKANYQVNVISNAELSKPALDKTVFADVKNIRIEDGMKGPPEVRDQAVTNDFKKFITTRNPSQPFFSFLFYDSAHSYCQVEDMSGPYKPYIKECNRFNLSNNTDPTPYLNRYKNVLQLVDHQLQAVIETLKQEKLLDHTVVIITGDHGEEFNDNHLNYWGHASNFTRYQVQTPLVVYWPHEKPQIFTHPTSHYDIASTLLTKLLRCSTTPSSYSLGSNLLDVKHRSYLIVGSYINFAVVQPNRIIAFFPSGKVDVEQPNGSPAQNGKLDAALMRNVFTDLRRFYQS